MSDKSAAITFLDFYIFRVFFGSVQNEDSGRVKGESSEVKILLSLCKGVELDFTSLFPLPRVLSKLSPGFLPSRTSPPSTLTTTQQLAIYSAAYGRLQEGRGEQKRGMEKKEGRDREIGRREG